MITADCDSVRDELDAFVDAELRGVDLVRVRQHLDGCRRCAEEVEARQHLGAAVRRSAVEMDPGRDLTGLAGRVVARVRAESAVSWRAMFERAVDDWHWVIVGGGSVAATFVSTLFCSALLLFGPVPERADSLSALVSNLGASPGLMYAEVTRPGSVGPMLVELDTGSQTSDLTTPLPVFPEDGVEQAWVRALGDRLAGGGPLVQLASMSERERLYTESLLDNIRRSQTRESRLGSVLEVHRLRLVTSTGVSAKGLRP